MKVKIESCVHVYLDFVCELPILGKIKFEWQDNNSLKYRVVNTETKDFIKEGFQTYEQADNWVSEQGYSLEVE